MSPDGKEPDKVEVFKQAQVLVERRRTPHIYARPSERERPPDLLAWWKVIRRRRRTVLTAFFVLFGAVLIGTLKQKPVYRAKALIEIDKENPSLVTSQELLQLDEVSDAYLETQYRVLTSGDLAERVIRQLALDHNPEFLPSPSPWLWKRLASLVSAAGPASGSAAAPARSLRESVLSHFEEGLDIQPFRRSRVVEIRFDSQDPDLAERVVNSLTENYIQKNLEARWAATQKTSDWLAQQLQDLKTKLEDSEDAMQKYAADNGLLYLETDKGHAESILDQSLRGLQEELTQAQADRFQKESLFGLVQAGEYGSLPGVVDNRLLQDLTVRLADLERDRAQLAATFKDDYPRVKEVHSQIAEVQSALDRERRRAAQKIGNDYFAALRREKLVQQAFAEKQTQANQFAAKSVQYGILSREVDSNKGLYEGLLQRLKEAGVSAGLKASNIRVVDPGTVSYKPVSPILPLNLGLAAFLGMALGVAIAFLQERLDQTLRNVDDVDQVLSMPVLGLIPVLKSSRGRKNKRISRDSNHFVFGLLDSKIAASNTPGMTDPNGHDISRASAWPEAFRELRTSVILSGAGRLANSILVTSAQAGEGKTTVAVNLAVSLAQLGQPVLLVDADLRRPGIQDYFPQHESHLSNFLAGHGAWQQMVVPTPVDGLYVLHAGPIPENPSELLSSERMRALMRESIATYRFVILDSPPLLSGADGRILGSMAGATILVVKSGVTPRPAVQYALSQARSVGTNLIGVVLNRLDQSQNDYSRYVRYRPNDFVGAA
jgi:succinoglycan biosynthesis transport protein ExoP